METSWYVAEMESDIECGECGNEFNSRENMMSRALLEFQLDENGKIQNVHVSKKL